jgi:drug/metabolite transporter (DMT)-like permease
VILVWGSTWLAIKVNIRYFPPLGAAGLRFVLAAALIAATAGRRRLPREGRPGSGFWLVLALTMIAIPYACVYWGEQFIPSGLTAVLFATYPLFVAVLAHAGVRGERLTLALLGGLACGFGGVVILFAGDLGAAGPGALLGGTMVLLSALSSAFSTIVVKQRLAHLDPLLINLRPMLIGGLILLAASFGLETQRPWIWSSHGLLSLLYLAVFGSALAFGTYYWLLRTIPVARLAFVVYVTPLVALGLGSWLEGEPFTPQMALGTALIIGGVALARRPAVADRKRGARLGSRPSSGTSW